MAARRNRHVRRRNRGRFGFLYKLLSTLLICAAILVGCLVFFRVDTIVITGADRYTEEEIIETTGVERGDNLYGLNKNQISRRLYTQLPYIDEVVINRRPPDTLLITVTESYPVAVLESGGEYWLLDARCKMLERGDAALAQGRARLRGLSALAPTVGLPLAVEQEQQDKLDSLKSLLSAIRDRGMTGSLTSFIDLTSDNEIRFGYGAELTIVMPMNGDFTDLTYKLKRVLETMDERGVARTGTLDLTYGDGEGHLLPERWLPSGAASEPRLPQKQTQGDTNDQTTQ